MAGGSNGGTGCGYFSYPFPDVVWEGDTNWSVEWLGGDTCRIVPRPVGWMNWICNDNVTEVAGWWSAADFLRAGEAYVQGDQDAAMDFILSAGQGTAMSTALAYSFGFHWERLLLPNAGPQVWHQNGLNLARPTLYATLFATTYDVSCDAMDSSQFAMGYRVLMDDPVGSLEFGVESWFEDLPGNWGDFWERAGNGWDNFTEWVG
jgi:hypothetical protein